MEKKNFRKNFRLMKWLQEDKYTLPDCYDIDRIVLMVRDPRCLYTYWDLSQKTREKYQDYLDQLVLRVSDVTDIIYDRTNAHFCWDVPVHIFTDNWYLSVDHNNRTYLVELGFYDLNNSFVVLLCSNPVLIPRDPLAAIFEQQLFWLLGRDEEIAHLPGVVGENIVLEEILLRQMLAAGKWKVPSAYTSGSFQGHWG